MKAIGIILAGGSGNRMGDLTSRRASAAMPVAGGYRAIDFALSNMSNSGIERVEVLPQFNAKSLTEHLNSSKWWDFGRKQGGLFVMHPTITYENNSWYRGTADAMHQNMEFLVKSHEPYVVICSGDGISKMDYNEVLDAHVQKDADITIVVKRMPEGADLTRFGVAETDENGRVLSLEEKPLNAKSQLVSTGVYLIRRRLLIDLLDRTCGEGRYNFVQDVLIRLLPTLKVYAFETKGYWNNVTTIESYYETNMDFLKPEVRDYFFKQYPPVYTKADDLPPAKYNYGSAIKNSLVASGSIINGTIENSVIFRNAFVGHGSVIRNSIIMEDVYIGENTTIENCIIESRDILKSNTVYAGEGGEIKVVLEKNKKDE
ncbi:MAG: glucose-1-phosphate adenylyltransferase subunit GlgD [Lachnospiraceae bacterium]|nr:glucose-1-phosphate adenylyltransferase subunit GlgD [Lachnospiraceae bacterium]